MLLSLRYLLTTIVPKMLDCFKDDAFASLTNRYDHCYRGGQNGGENLEKRLSNGNLNWNVWLWVDQGLSFSSFTYMTRNGITFIN